MINVGEKLPPPPRTEARSSAAVAGEAVGRMPRIAAAILPAHIGDGGVGTLALHFERGNPRVLRIDGDAVGFALGDEAHGVMTRHVLNLPPWSIVPQPKMSMRRRLCAVALPLCISGVDGASPGLELFSSVPDFAGCWKVSGAKVRRVAARPQAWWARRWQARASPPCDSRNGRCMGQGAR